MDRLNTIGKFMKKASEPSIDSSFKESESLYCHINSDYLYTE